MLPTGVTDQKAQVCQQRMWHTSSTLDITKREVILKTKLGGGGGGGGVSFDGTLAMATN